MHTNQRVDTRQVVAATRIIPLMIRAEGIALVEDVCGRDFPVIQIKPFASLNIGTLTTGSEVHKASVFDLVSSFPRPSVCRRDYFPQFASGSSQLAHVARCLGGLSGFCLVFCSYLPPLAYDSGKSVRK